MTKKSRNDTDSRMKMWLCRNEGGRQFYCIFSSPKPPTKKADFDNRLKLWKPSSKSIVLAAVIPAESIEPAMSPSVVLEPGGGPIAVSLQDLSKDDDSDEQEEK